MRLLSDDDGDITVGAPTVEGAKVTAEVVQQGRGKKVIVFKYKAKTRYRRKNGHRQNFTELRVTDIRIIGRWFDRLTTNGFTSKTGF